MAYRTDDALNTFSNYLDIGNPDSSFKIKPEKIKGTNGRGLVLKLDQELNAEESVNNNVVIFIYPIVHKQDNSKNYFDTRDSGPHARVIAWNYAIEHKYKYFCLGINDSVDKYKNYIFSLECNENVIQHLSGTENGDRSPTSKGNQIIIPNEYKPTEEFDRIKNKLGTYIAVIRKDQLYNYLKMFDNRPYMLDASKINVDAFSGDESEDNDLPTVLDSQLEFKSEILPETFQTDFARRYITSLLAKPFVILTGNSGTGKTRISKQFAEYLEEVSEDGEKNWILAPVGADWTDNTKILGFYNPLANEGQGAYEKTEILKLIERADKEENRNKPFFIILDEMNLSHVERYFADFLSHMETPDLPFHLDGYGELNYPANLFVVGTVNIDETTYMFSPKVLDRANVIEFKPEKKSVMNLFLRPAADTKVLPASDGSAEAFMKLAFEIRGEQSGLDDDALQDIVSLFDKIYEITQKSGYEFAYRTVREIRQYISAAFALDKEHFDLKRAEDEQLLQKVLPKIHGNKKELQQLLDNLENLCKERHLEQSGAKIEQMKGKLAQVQYASFI